MEYKTISNYFDNIYCINLKSRPDRWKQATDEFNKFNINTVKRYNAVDGSKVTNPNPRLLKGEVGVLLTHINLIEMAQRRGYKNILILEDDVYFTDELLKLEEYMNSVPEDWDMLYFGANHVYGKLPLEIINEKIVRLNYSVGLQCVAIKNTMFDKILDIVPNIDKQIDAYYADMMKSYNIYCFNPNMALQREGFSDIQQQNVNYDRFFKNF
jgi:GR25 family glycosyltransferase involved in LPS biosynthesis